MAVHKKAQQSLKHVAIDKTTKMILTVVLSATVLVVFGIAGSRALIMKIAHQNQVISQKKATLAQLDENINSVDKLVASYREFNGSNPNLLGGNANPTPDQEGDRDGNNSKIILDALPSVYDFPALASSIEKIIGLGAYQVNSIIGTDDELLQDPSVNGQSDVPIEIPFGVGVSTSYIGAQQLLIDLNRSIRPIHILNIEFSGGETNMEVKIEAKTYYLPSKSLLITTKELR